MTIKKEVVFQIWFVRKDKVFSGELFRESDSIRKVVDFSDMGDVLIAWDGNWENCIW